MANPKLQQLLDSLQARGIERMLLPENRSAQVFKAGAWSESPLRVTPELLQSLGVGEVGEREEETASGRYAVSVKTAGGARLVLLKHQGANAAQLKAQVAPSQVVAPPPVAANNGANAVRASEVKASLNGGESSQNARAFVADLKAMPTAPAPAAPVPPHKQQWFYELNGEQIGPKPRALMQSLILAGTVGHETLVWREGLSDWVRASESELASLLPAAMQEVAAPLPTAPATEPFSKIVDEWHYRDLNGERIGPISWLKVRGRLGLNSINAQTLVWKEGMSEWVPLEQTELRQFLAGDKVLGMVNDSGNKDAVLPKGLEGPNWGAFFFPALWCFAHNLPVWGVISLFVPLAPNIYLAVKGNEMAWRSRSWVDATEFETVQGVWARCGGYIFFACFLFVVLGEVYREVNYIPPAPAN